MPLIQTLQNRKKKFICCFFYDFLMSLCSKGWLVYSVLRHFQQYFSYVVAVSLIGGGNRRKPPTNFITKLY